MKRRYLPLLLSTIIAVPLSWPAAAAGYGSLTPFGASYRLTTGKLQFGEVRVELELSPTGAYRYRATTSPVGLAAVVRSDRITEQSSGHISACRITPEHYLYRHQQTPRPREVELRFDWAGGRVINHARESHWNMQIPDGTQDKFSQQLALMLGLSQTCGGPLQFPVADGGRLKQYRFKRDLEEWIETPAGRFRTLRLVRSKNGKPSKATLWLAPKLGYLPVKIEKRDSGGEVVMELRSFTRGPQGPENSPALQ